MSAMGIQIINQSEQIGATETRRIAQACHIQLHRDVADDGTPYMKVGITETLNNGDPISAQSYRIKVGDGTNVPVSNFVTPYYFVDADRGKPLDYQRKLDEPFSIAEGGYRVDMRAGAVKNTYAKGFPRRKQQQIAVGHGRTFWRNVTMAIAMR